MANRKRIALSDSAPRNEEAQKDVERNMRSPLDLLRHKKITELMHGSGNDTASMQ